MKSILGSFEALKRFARFDGSEVVIEPEAVVNHQQAVVLAGPPPPQASKFNLSYTINLNLPETSNAAVFDAIFKSIRENLLKQDV